MRYDYVSAFAISESDKKAVEKGMKTHPFFNPVSFCYVKEPHIIEESVKYLSHLEDEFQKLQADPKSFESMVSYEMANHEACYTGSYTDALAALNLNYNDLSDEKKHIVDEELKRQCR